MRVSYCFTCLFLYKSFCHGALRLDTHLNCLKQCIIEHLFDLNDLFLYRRIVLHLPQMLFVLLVFFKQNTPYVSFLSLLYYRYANLVDGNWSSWSQWTKCDVTCANGTQIRTRSCTNPAPAHGGVNCSGTDRDTMPCTLDPCPGNFDAATSFCLPFYIRQILTLYYHHNVVRQ